MSKITDAVWHLAEPITQELGLELWDVEYVREGGANYLRIYIDRPGAGVFIDDCEAVSKAMDPILDEADPVPNAYTFEVSSAGLERELRRPEHYVRYLGSPVEVRLFRAPDGRKRRSGILAGYEDGAVLLEEDGAKVRFEKNEVSGVRLRME